jgi:hypothetical protein
LQLIRTADCRKEKERAVQNWPSLTLKGEQQKWPQASYKAAWAHKPTRFYISVLWHPADEA